MHTWHAREIAHCSAYLIVHLVALCMQAIECAYKIRCDTILPDHQHAGAQCAHAAVGILGRYQGSHESLFHQWEANGQPKIALKVKDHEEIVCESSGGG